MEIPDSRTALIEPEPMDPKAVTQRWLRDFETALTAGDADAVGALFVADGWWRDQLVSPWNLQTVHGRDAIVDHLAPRLANIGVHSFVLDPGFDPQVVPGPDGPAWIQAIMSCEVTVGRASAVVRLVPVPDAETWRAWIFFARLDTLTGHGPAIGCNRPMGVVHGGHRSQVTWLQRRERQREFLDADPDVLVVGGGQSGLSLAAELGQLDLPTLVVERYARVGDT